MENHETTQSKLKHISSKMETMRQYKVNINRYKGTKSELAHSKGHTITQSILSKIGQDENHEKA